MKYLLYIICCIFTLLPAYGQYWKPAVLPEPYNQNYWLDVYFLPANPQYGWICGFEGMVVRTVDGGQTWKGTTVLGAEHLESIQFLNQSVGYTSGTEGIFKSTDGGESWRNITPTLPPDLAAITVFWGSYFIDENDGMLLGGGCGGTAQVFLRTQDGGTTWTMFLGNESNSGMTDPLILTKNGEGYACSSGIIWQTLDGGSTWSVFSRTVGNPLDNKWQEEITKLGSSFLIPYAGQSCTGEGSGGGMYFSINNGLSWNTYSVPDPLFGAFLIDQHTGWACGYNGGIYYTADAGNTWQLKNCGVKGGNLDDIWFISPTKGWVVGQGVYYLNQEEAYVSKDSMNFGELCVPAEVLDTLYYANNSFLDKKVSIFINSNYSNNYFSLVNRSVNTQYTVPSCDTLAIIVKYAPSAAVYESARLSLIIDGGNQLDVYLTGTGIKSTIKPSCDTLFMKNVVCNTLVSSVSKWTANYKNEVIDSFYKAEKTNLIWDSLKTPFHVYYDTSRTKINCCPVDTGWIYANYMYTTLPCKINANFCVAAYGISPIINAKVNNRVLECDMAGVDSIDIKNTGNTSLRIESIKFSNSNYKLDNINFPLIIDAGHEKYVKYNFAAETVGNFYNTITIVNNDSTKVRGNMNPLMLSMNTQVNKSILAQKDTTIDFGIICFGVSDTASVTIRNRGNKNTIVDMVKFANDIKVINKPVLPYVLEPGDSIVSKIVLKPTEIRKYVDTLKYISNDCIDTVKVILKAASVNVDIAANPSTLHATLKTGEAKSITVNIKSNSSETVKITNIKLNPESSNINLICEPTPEFFLDPGENKDLTLTLKSSVDMSYSGDIIIETASECLKEINIPLTFQSYSGDIRFSQDILDFGTFYCDFPVAYDTLTIYNKAAIIDTLENFEISPANGAFYVFNPIQTPHKLNADDSCTIIIKYQPHQAENDSTTLKLKFRNSGDYVFNIPIRGSVKIPICHVKDDNIDFGKFLACSDTVFRTLRFINLGNAADTLDYFDAFDCKAKNLVVYANDSAAIALDLVPSNISEYGGQSQTIRFRGRQCGDTIDVRTTFYKIDDRYVIEPSEVSTQLASIAETDTIYFAIKIKNIGEIPLTLKNEISGSNNNFFFVNNANKLNINSKDSLNVICYFTGDKAGSYNADIVFTRDSCNKVDIKQYAGNIYREDLSALLYYGNYTRTPGDTLTLDLMYKGNLKNIKADSINITTSFDKYLYLPSNVLVKSNNKFEDISYSYKDGELNCMIPKNYADSLFNKEGAVLKVLGTVYFHNPNYTDIRIDKFNINTRKTYSIDTLNGRLNLSGYCIPAGDLIDFEENPVLNIKAYYDENDEIKIETESEQPASVVMEIMNVSGEVVESRKISVPRGKCELNYNARNIPSGLYFLKFSNDIYNSMQKLLIYK